MIKECRYCGKEFEIQHSSNYYCSKECSKKAKLILTNIWKHKPKNREKIQKQREEYRKRPSSLKKSKEYYQNNKERDKKKHKIWEENNREHMYQKRKEWKLNNKEKILMKQKKGNEKLNKLRKLDGEYREKYLAEQKASHFMKKNRIKLENLKCSICQSEENIIKHHPNYSKPLEIVFLCKRCHSKLHNGIINPDKLEVINLRELKENK